MVLSPGHWIMLSEGLNNDDLMVNHLTLANIHLDDANVKEFCKVWECQSQKNTKMYCAYCDLWHLQVISLVESVHLSGLGHCGHYTTYSSFPDMDTEVWTCLKVQYKITFCRVGVETRKLINCDIIVAYISSSCSYSYLTGHPQLLSCPDSPHSSFVILRSLAHFTITSSLSFNVCCPSSKLSVSFHATWK